MEKKKEIKIFAKLIIWFLILFLSKPIILARTRDDVVVEAERYKNYPWTVSSKNILDVEAPFGVDDRPGWPYYVGWSGEGEAYGWGMWDTTEEFANKLSLGQIAGRRSGDPEGYMYTGIDCSGLVSRVLGLGQHLSTDELSSRCIEIDVDYLRCGDILVKPRSATVEGHVVIFVSKKSWKENQKLANIIHSTSYHWQGGSYVWRVVSDVATVYGDNREPHTLGARFQDGYTPYTPFPLITLLIPKPNTYTTAYPTIQTQVRSGTDLDVVSLTMKLDDAEVPARKMERPDKKNMVLEYRPIFPLPDGIHKVSQYAKNELLLEDEERFNFGVDGTPPEVKLKKPQIKVFVPQNQWPNGSYKNPIDYSLDVEFSLTDNVGLGEVFVFIDNKKLTLCRVVED